MRKMEMTGRKKLLPALSAAFPLTIPVLTGFLVLGMAYGMLMRTKGYGTPWAVLMSALAFCGSMQFAAITLLTAVFDPLQAFWLSLMVNARHLFYGISMLEKYRGLGKVRSFLIFALCDETFSIASGCSPPMGVSRKYFYFFISLLDYLYWILGTFLGSVLGGLVRFNTEGMDFVLTALFVVLLLEQTKRRENRVFAGIGLACTAAARWFFGAERLVLPAMGLILLILLAGRKKLCR
jgi:4-azaleucine resistance transporter AzlC